MYPTKVISTIQHNPIRLPIRPSIFLFLLRGSKGLDNRLNTCFHCFPRHRLFDETETNITCAPREQIKIVEITINVEPLDPNVKPCEWGCMSKLNNLPIAYIIP